MVAKIMCLLLKHFTVVVPYGHNTEILLRILFLYCSYLRDFDKCIDVPKKLASIFLIIFSFMWIYFKDLFSQEI